MSLKITDDMMISDQTVNVARRLKRRGGWWVSWLPDRTLDWEQAITAMTLADLWMEQAERNSTGGGTNLHDAPDAAAQRIESLATELEMDDLRAGELIAEHEFARHEAAEAVKLSTEYAARTREGTEASDAPGHRG